MEKRSWISHLICFSPLANLSQLVEIWISRFTSAGLVKEATSIYMHSHLSRSLGLRGSQTHQNAGSFPLFLLLSRVNRSSRSNACPLPPSRVGTQVPRKKEKKKRKRYVVRKAEDKRYIIYGIRGRMLPILSRGGREGGWSWLGGSGGRLWFIK